MNDGFTDNNTDGKGSASVVASATTQAPQSTDWITPTIVIVVVATCGIVVLFLLDKKGVITLKKKSRA